MIKSPERYAASSASQRPNTATAVHREDILPKRKAFGQMWTWRNLKLLEPRILSKIDTFLDFMGQQDELAETLTTLHTTKFGVLRLFVNVAFNDVSTANTYIGGKRRKGNHIRASVRLGDRTNEDFKGLCQFPLATCFM